MFGYATYAESGVGWVSASELLVIAGLVVFGALVGIVVNMLVYPPIRYRSAEYAVGNVSANLGYFITDMGCRLWYREPDDATVRDLQERARELSDLFNQAHAALDNAVESSRLNPRRLFNWQPKLYSTDRALLNSLTRSHDVALSIARGLHYIAQQCESGQETDPRFRELYATVLIRLAKGLRHIGRLHSVERAGRLALIDRDIEVSDERYRRLVQHAEGQQLDVPGTAPVYGSLLVDLRRMVEELRAARDEIDQVVVPLGDGLPERKTARQGV